MKRLASILLLLPSGLPHGNGLTVSATNRVIGDFPEKKCNVSGIPKLPYCKQFNMKKATVSKIAQSIAALVALCATSAHAALIAHYTFDVDNAGSTPDSVGSNTAALGNQVLINTTVSGRIGAGALEMTNVGTGKTAAANGAVTSKTPFSPSSGPTQWLFQGPPAQSKLLAATLPNLQGSEKPRRIPHDQQQRQVMAELRL